MRWIAIVVARLLEKRFVVHYPDGERTYRMPYDHARPLQQIHGGTLEICWKEPY